MAKQQSYRQKWVYDWSDDGVPDTIATDDFYFDKRGYLVKELHQTDEDANGTVDWTTGTDYVRNKDGTVKSSIEKYDWDGNSVIDTATTTFQYKHGAVSKQVTLSDVSSDGTIDGISTTINKVNKKGLITDSVTQSDFGADGTIDHTSHNVYGFDKHGKLNYEAQDRNSDGNFELITTTTPFNDGTKSYRVFVIDDWLDTGTVQQHRTAEYVFNKKGLQTGFHTTSDWGADGSIDERTDATYTYTKDKNGSVNTVFYESVGHDGSVSTLELKLEYNKKGFLTSETHFFERNDDGGWGQINKYDYTLDAKGRPIEKFYYIDNPPGGQMDGTQHTVMEYDKKGTLIYQAETWLHDHSGDPYYGGPYWETVMTIEPLIA